MWKGWSQVAGSGWFGSLATIPARFGRITTHRRYLSEIDGLRALALLPVLVWHAALRADRLNGAPGSGFVWGYLFPDGEAGVDLFFAISGFIIALPFLRRPEVQYRKLDAFYLRRLSRLGPPYVLILVVCFILLSVSHYAPADALRFRLTTVPLWQSFVASFFYVHGLLLNAPPKLNPPLWSLEVEAQFYLIAPLLLAPFVKVRLLRGAVGVVCVLALCAVCSYFNTGRYFDQPQGKTILAYLPFFLVGVTCTGWAEEAPNQTSWADVLMPAGYLLLWASGRYQSLQDFGPVLLRDETRIGCIYLILFGALRGSFVRRVLSNPWMTLLGAMCYSIYLTHVPLMQSGLVALHRLFPSLGSVPALAVAMVTLIPSAIVVGFGYFLLVERPSMDPLWPKRLGALLSGRCIAAEPPTGHG